MHEIREAVILAAGLGTRLRGVSEGLPKFLVKILDKPLVTYPLRTLYLVGIKRFAIVIPKGWYNELNNIVSSLGLDIDVCIVENSSIERENGYSLLISNECVKSKYFILSMSDHLYTPDIPLTLLKFHEYTYDVDIIVGADSNPKYIDINEATKIYASNTGRVIKVGKGISRFNYVDIGVFIMSSKVYDVIQELVLEHKVIKLADVVNEAVIKGLNVFIADVNGATWTEVDTPRDLNELIYGTRREVLNSLIKLFGELHGEVSQVY